MQHRPTSGSIKEAGWRPLLADLGTVCIGFRCTVHTLFGCGGHKRFRGRIINIPCLGEKGIGFGYVLYIPSLGAVGIEGFETVL